MRTCGASTPSTNRDPRINAIIVINPEVRAQAAELDRRMKASGPVWSAPLHPLHRQGQLRNGRPADCRRLSRAEGLRSGEDAFQVKRIKEAGALVLAKSNMAEWAFSPYETVNSLLPGYTRNPYALDRVTAGSSGGTAAAVAASFGAVGLGSDTGNSIRGPSSHQASRGFARRWGLPVAPGSCRSTCSRILPDRWPARSRMRSRSFK